MPTWRIKRITTNPVPNSLSTTICANVISVSLGEMVPNLCSTIPTPMLCLVVMKLKCLWIRSGWCQEILVWMDVLKELELSLNQCFWFVKYRMVIIKRTKIIKKKKYEKRNFLLLLMFWYLARVSGVLCLWHTYRFWNCNRFTILLRGDYYTPR